MKKTGLFLAALLCTSGLFAASSFESAEARDGWRNNRGNHYGWRNNRSGWQRQQNQWRRNNWSNNNNYRSGWNWDNRWRNNNNNWYGRSSYGWY